MRPALFSSAILILVISCILVLVNIQAFAQKDNRQIISMEDYAEGYIEPDDAYLATLEEWQTVIEQWLEDPICLNNEESDWLVDYKIISLYQLNKLKEYRLIYSNLLSVYELGFIEGWDFQTVRKVMPLVTVELPESTRNYQGFSFRSIHQSLLVKTQFNTEKSKAYRFDNAEDTSISGLHYSGSPVRLALRYDLAYRNKIVFGFRIEKDPGEPFLVINNSKNLRFKAPDLLSGYLLIRHIGPVQSVILGNYRVNFGYGLNLAGGMTGIKGRNGMPGLADRISPQTSVSETGFFRGVAIRAALNMVSITCFASRQNMDGTSVHTDSITGLPESFSSLNSSGLHRTADELAGRKLIMEDVLGAFIVYSNNWMKAGFITIYNKFNAEILSSNRPYARFGLTGNENLVTGLSTTVWLPKIQFLSELSLSKNKGMALLSAVQLNPVPGIIASATYRKFDRNFHNWHGSGFLSAGNNSDETGIQVKIRTELPKKYLVEIIADESRQKWASYDLAAPSSRSEFKVLTEKAWAGPHSLCFTFSYQKSQVKDTENSEMICHPVSQNHYRFRLEGRITVTDSIRLKSRVELNTIKNAPAGWLVFQDIEISTGIIGIKVWLRACFFDVSAYENRIYSYENDVLYDFSSFMHYGKGLRGISMLKYCPADWIDLWLRMSTVYYTNKYIGSGWEEIGENRQNEFEIQARIRLPG
jgi:hypothetical protein